jgi:hypothetical protein
MITATSSKRCSKPPIAYIAIDHASHKSRPSRSHVSANASGQKMTSRRRHQRRWLMEVATGCTITIARAVLIYLAAFLTYSLVNNFNHIYNLFRLQSGVQLKLRMPVGLDQVSRRTLSLNLGGGNCKWQVRR